MKPLTAHEVKILLLEGKDKYMIVRELSYQGKTFLVERANKSNVIGRVKKGILSCFNTQVCSVPLQYFEFMDTETYKHQRDLAESK